MIYQIYPRSFQDSDGDGIGDLPGLIHRLPHVADLGADAIWISPFFVSPMHDMGYDVADYRDVDPVFGTLADFDRLVTAAHELGLRVLIDQVISHCSAEHPVFSESRQSRTGPKADWFVWAEAAADGSPPNNWLSEFGGSAWTWAARRNQYYLHNFLPTQPDFNFHNPEVRAWHLANMGFWLDRGVDGFRLDAINFTFCDPELRDNPPLAGVATNTLANPYDMQDHCYDKSRPEAVGFVEEIRRLADRYGEVFLLGEIGDEQQPVRLMAEYSAPGRLHSCYSFELLGSELSGGHVRRCVEEFFGHAPSGMPTWAFSNHDVPRHVSRWSTPDTDPEDLARMACTLLLSLPGAICIYQGEELGMPDAVLRYEDLLDPMSRALWPDGLQRDASRTPMVWDAAARSAGFSTGVPWLPVGNGHDALAAEAQKGSSGSVLETYRAMISIRNSTPSLRTAGPAFLAVPEPALAFTRGQVAAVFNLSDAPIDVEMACLGPALAQHGAQRQGSTLTLASHGYGVFALADATDVHQSDSVDRSTSPSIR